MLAAKRATAARYSSRVDSPDRSQRIRLEVALHRVHVGVLEAGQEQPAGEVDLLRAGRHLEVRVRHDRDDQPVAHDRAVRLGSVPLPVVHAAATQHGHPFGHAASFMIYGISRSLVHCSTT